MMMMMMMMMMVMVAMVVVMDLFLVVMFKLSVSRLLVMCFLLPSLLPFDFSLAGWCAFDCERVLVYRSHTNLT